MRVAEICPDCATYINAACIIYNGDYLPVLDVSPLDSLDDILGNINDAFTSQSGAGVPTTLPLFVGQLYVDTLNLDLYIGLTTTGTDWALIGPLSTTTTTTTA